MPAVEGHTFVLRFEIEDLAQIWHASWTEVIPQTVSLVRIKESDLIEIIQSSISQLKSGMYECVEQK